MIHVDDDVLSDHDSDDEESVVLLRYRTTDSEDWSCVREGEEGGDVSPIPYTRESELFNVNITEEELEQLKDDNGDIRYYKVVEHLLPKFDGESYFEFLAARMRSYMTHIMRSDGYKPKWYDPENNHVILGDHVCRFFGVQTARMLRGYPSINDTWPSRESLDEVGVVTKCMSKNAFQDMYRCLHFADDWDEEDGVKWDDVYLDSKYKSPDLARHRAKFATVEDAYNARWKEVVIFGRCLTFDESRIAGWYKSAITIGPDPKPIRTGATVHSMCVTFGPLAGFKLHVRVYGGKTDEDLCKTTSYTGTTQKFINLLDEFLSEFKGLGHYATMDSAYMGDVMAQIGREAWKINMVGTTQSNRVGADVKEERKRMKVGTYECVFYQHNELPLCVALWADNNIVTTLSNFHSPTVLQEGEGMLHRKKGGDGKRERVRTPVKCPAQNKTYSLSFHQIDKSNGKEAKYDLGGKSQTHNWCPKIVLRLFNIGNSNSCVYYERLLELYTPNRRKLKMKEAIYLRTE